jgi:hypothetical protein
MAKGHHKHTKSPFEKTTKHFENGVGEDHLYG